MMIEVRMIKEEEWIVSQKSGVKETVMEDE